jgi:uncharacterized protein
MATPEGAPIVRVLYALPEEQVVVEVPYEAGMTAALAVERSGLMRRYPALAREPLVLGIWGTETDAAGPVRAGDRVEISRPLVADPREMRRELMTDGRVMGGAQTFVIRKKDRA